MWIMVKKILSLALTITGAVLAIYFFIQAVPTNVWHCGIACGAFIALFWLSFILAVVGGILMLMTWGKKGSPAE